MNVPDMDLDVIIHGVALHKQKNKLGQTIVILPVRKDETALLPYHLEVTVKIPLDIKFPNYKTRLTIDGIRDASNALHPINASTLKCKTMLHQLLAFGPMRKSTTSLSQHSSNESVGKITVVVSNCKFISKQRNKTTSKNNATAFGRQGDFTASNKFEIQKTKWKTVSAGNVPPSDKNYTCVNGNFHQQITILYMDHDTMEHNQRLVAPMPMPVPRVPTRVHLVTPNSSSLLPTPMPINRVPAPTRVRSATPSSATQLPMPPLPLTSTSPVPKIVRSVWEILNSVNVQLPETVEERRRQATTHRPRIVSNRSQTQNEDSKKGVEIIDLT